MSPISDAFNHVPGQNDPNLVHSDTQKRVGLFGNKQNTDKNTGETSTIDHSILSNGPNDGKKDVLAKLAPRSSLIGTWTNDQSKTKFDQPLEYIRAAQKKSIGQPGRSISAAASISRPMSVLSDASNSPSTSIVASPKTGSPSSSINVAVNNIASAFIAAPPSPTHMKSNPNNNANNNITLTESFESVTIPRNHAIPPPDIDGSPKSSARAPRTSSVDSKNNGNRGPVISSILQPPERIRLEIKKPMIGSPGHQHNNHNEKSARSAFIRNAPSRRRLSAHIQPSADAPIDREDHLEDLLDEQNELETTVQKFRRMKNEEKFFEPPKIGGWLPTLASDSKSMKKDGKSLAKSLARSFSRDGHSLPREVPQDNHDIEANVPPPNSAHPPLVNQKSTNSNMSNHKQDKIDEDTSLVEDFNSIYLFNNPSYFAK